MRGLQKYARNCFGYFIKILLITLCTEAKIQRLKEAILKNTKQKRFENKKQNLGLGQMFCLKIRWPKPKPKDRKLKLRPIN